jgi:glycosyltransferase involved in cell wall biosynthesis
VPPLEIIIVDQTVLERRDHKLSEHFAYLPLRVIFQDEPGQCTSRNTGLQAAQGDYILFIDDDDEVPPDLIESHLRTLAEFQAHVSSGVAEEVGAGPLPPDFRLLRASDVFPTNNSMVRKSVLHRSGLFDLAYDHKQRADGDLGMRLYLAGGMMVLNPSISVVHHHAPSGGLRQHKARTTTYALSRRKLSCRTLASTSEFYLAQRYFPQTHIREMLWQSLLGTFSMHAGFAKCLAKLLLSTFFLPQSVARLRNHAREARAMSRTFPQIETLHGKASEGAAPPVTSDLCPLTAVL